MFYLGNSANLKATSFFSLTYVLEYDLRAKKYLDFIGHVAMNRIHESTKGYILSLHS